MAKQNLTDRMLKALKPARPGTRYERWDGVVPGLGVRVTDGGTRTFVLLARYPGSGNPTRRALGEYGVITLEDARVKARHWHELIHQGKDPALEEERKRQAEVKRQATTFAAVAEEFTRYIRRQKLRSAEQMERDLQNVFVARWARRPITEIGADDIKRIIREAVDRGAPYRAFKLFALIRRLFNWAIGTDDYGLELNPCRRLNTKDLIGERHARGRVLSNDELFALWRVTRRLGYPYGPLYRLLTLSGLRLNEACGADWGEFDFVGRLWEIPASRMKKVKGGARPHVVPLTEPMLELLQDLPRFSSGTFLFSHSYGKRPLKPNQFSDPKEARPPTSLDLACHGAAAGEDPRRIKPPEHFVNHDIRRSVRTHLSALRVPEEVREAVLAHVRPGIKGVYDKYQYLDEAREALTLWGARLLAIVQPKPSNVVRLRKQA